ncbi:gluconate kinase [Bifidobacterium sp. 82T24]|uniref:xylulokinase n=1 Tax=Bifidobacterium pluvialisilvae TaxID=2834436 RepID=UPI001C559D10|nr:FGGY family carbohydrate kinase [Bifidobacterium pluvialisilvae]MBW3088150.1 gluconate kinase [Bifidobacterium pluvialisilvae]
MSDDTNNDTQYAAVFDAGTTALKGAIVTSDGHIIASHSEQLDLITNNDQHEQNPNQWWQAFRTTSQHILHQTQHHEPDFNPRTIAGIILSGQMQDLITLDDNLNPVRNAILYSDGRADKQATALADAYPGGKERFLNTVGNPLEGGLPLPKLMWLHDNDPSVFARVRHVLISSKDYLIAQLTGGALIGDVAACTTAGAMNIHSRQWDTEICEAAGIDPILLPRLHNPQDVVGTVSATAHQLTGFAIGTPVHAGIGDAGATTLASGVGKPGEYNINLGTSGWIATISDEPFTNRPGAANLAFGAAPGYVNAVPFLNAGDVHRWATHIFADGDYPTAHNLIEHSQPGANGILCLPYLVGERFPVMNPTIRGAYIGISPDTTKGDLLRAALEGVAYSIRQGMESFDTKPRTISLIGGGGQEPAWCQIMADVLDHPVEVFTNAEILPAVALASLVFKRPDLIHTVCDSTIYTPHTAATQVYDVGYRRFAELYPTLSALH